MGVIPFVKDLGRRLGVGNTSPAQSAQTPGAPRDRLSGERGVRPGGRPDRREASVPPRPHGSWEWGVARCRPEAQEGDQS